MNGIVSWMIEISIKDGELDNFKAILKEMVEATEKNEPETLLYDCCISDDNLNCHFYERYANSAAAMLHLGTFGEEYAERFMASATPTRFTVYGNPDEDVRGVLDNFGAVYMTSLSGFSR